MDIEKMKIEAKEFIENDIRLFEESIIENLEGIIRDIREIKAREVVHFAFRLRLITAEEYDSYCERLRK